jgi:hypothetical protein
MMIAILMLQQAMAWEVSSLESAQLVGTAHAPRQGDIFIRPLGSSSFGITDRLAVSSNPLGWVQGTPNISSEFNLVDNWDWALSITPYVTTNFGLTEFYSGVAVTHSLQYAEDRLNTTLRLGYVGLLGAEDEIEPNAIEGELGLSYDIVATRAIVHRFKGSISSGVNLPENINASVGYSFHASLGQRARVELGIDFGEPSSATGVFFKEQYSDAVFGEDLAGQAWIPSPNASLFWVF